jgi:hypothetical protein
MYPENPLLYEQVQGELFGIMPELALRFRKEFEGLYDLATENPGNYLLFEDIVFPFIRELAGDVSNEQVLKGLFNFFERMASSSDPPVSDLLGIAVTEQLAAQPEVLRAVGRNIGTRTRQMVDRDLKLLRPLTAERM